MTTGLLTIDSATYHADQIDDDRPSLSKSIIHTLIEKSPAHARIAHPRLNRDFQREDDPKFDLGNASHALFLEGNANVHIVAANAWTTKDAKEQRETARQHGRTPMLAKDYERCEALVEAVRRQCDEHEAGPFFTDGKAEETLVWEDEYGVLCRSRLDWLTNDHSAVHDLKTTGKQNNPSGASPDAWSRTALSIGADLQAAFYLRGCEKVLGVRPDFYFVVCEVGAPYAMSVFGIAPDTLALAEKKIDYALKTWAMCLRNDEWPSYPAQVAHITTPPYIEAAWLERELREVEAA